MDQQACSLTDQIAELFEQHGGVVLHRCRQLLKDEAAADDAAQEVFLRVIQNLESFRGEASPVSWIYRIATNICLDELRRRARRAAVELTPELLEALSGSERAAEEVVVEKDQLAWLLGRTDPASVQILVHSALDEMTQEEIARVMGLSRKTVWTKLQRLKLKLARRTRRTGK
jgi:RNA polymerase sigma-70 factor (ECF subfamily)